VIASFAGALRKWLWVLTASATAGIALHFAAGFAAEPTAIGDDGADGVLPIIGEGVAEPAAPRKIVSRIRFVPYWGFCPTITEIVPEWSHVQAGDLICRMYSPQSTDEKNEKEQALLLAEANAAETNAEADAEIAELESALATARVALRQAQKRLAAVRALPDAGEHRMLLVKIAQNKSRREYTLGRIGLLQELVQFGLCCTEEVTSEQHKHRELTSHERYLQAAFDELEAQCSTFEARKALLETEKAALKVRIAETRQELASQRQRLLCEAARLGDVESARRALDLAVQLRQALSVHAPAAGYVLYGDEWQWWDSDMPTGKISVGSPIYPGQTIVSIIDPSQVRMKVQVKEEDILKLSVGDPAEIAFAAARAKTYHGVVEKVLPVVTARKQSAWESDPHTFERYGQVWLRAGETDRRIIPGMKARVLISPNGGGEPEGAAAGPARVPEKSTLRMMDRQRVVLKGLLVPRSKHWVRAPFEGRLVWLAPHGITIKPGQLVARIEIGLNPDWVREDDDELEQLGCLRQAARLQLDLAERVAPLALEAAEIDVRLARLRIEELQSQPRPDEKILAQNKLAEARWKRDKADKKLDAYRQLAAGGLTSEMEVKKRLLHLDCANAAVLLGEADLEKVARGPSQLDHSLAQAELRLAQAALEKTRARTRSDVETAKAELVAAEARLASFGAAADRRRKKSGEADVHSPVGGVVLRRFSLWEGAYEVHEGEEMWEGQVILQVADASQAVVSATMDESDYYRISVGNPARVTLAGNTELSFAGRVASVTGAAPQSAGESNVKLVQPTRRYQVTIELEDKPPLCVGMSAVVEVFPSPDESPASMPVASSEEAEESAGVGDADATGEKESPQHAQVD